MLAKSRVDEVFNEHKKNIIHILGRDALSNVDIDKFGKSAFRTHWGGCMSEDTVILNPRNANKYYILNTGNKRSTGIHWTGLYIGSGKTIYAYDSFGRHSSLILRQLIHQAKHKDYKIVESNHDHEQRGYSALCGQISLSWLLAAKDLGIKNALQI